MFLHLLIFNIIYLIGVERETYKSVHLVLAGVATRLRRPEEIMKPVAEGCAPPLITPPPYPPSGMIPLPVPGPELITRRAIADLPAELLYPFLAIL